MRSARVKNLRASALLIFCLDMVFYKNQYIAASVRWICLMSHVWLLWCLQYLSPYDDESDKHTVLVLMSQTPHLLICLWISTLIEKKSMHWFSSHWTFNLKIQTNLVQKQACNYYQNDNISHYSTCLVHGSQWISYLSFNWSLELVLYAVEYSDFNLVDYIIFLNVFISIYYSFRQLRLSVQSHLSNYDNQIWYMDASYTGFWQVRKWLMMTYFSRLSKVKIW